MHTHHLVSVPAEAILRFPSSHSPIPIVVPLPQTTLVMLMYIQSLWGWTRVRELVHIKILLIAWLDYFYSKHIYCAISQGGQTTLHFFFNWTEGMGWILRSRHWKEKLLKSAFQPKESDRQLHSNITVSSSAQRWRSTDFHFQKTAEKISQALAECKHGGIMAFVQVEVKRDTKYHQEQQLAISTKTQADFLLTQVFPLM